MSGPTGGFHQSAQRKHWNISNHISFRDQRWETNIFACSKETLLVSRIIPHIIISPCFRTICTNLCCRMLDEYFSVQVQTWRCWVAGLCGRSAWTTATAPGTVLGTTLEFTSVRSLLTLHWQHRYNSENWDAFRGNYISQWNQEQIQSMWDFKSTFQWAIMWNYHEKAVFHGPALHPATVNQ